MENLQPQQAKSFMEATAKLQSLNLFFDYLKGSKYDIYTALTEGKKKEERRKNPFRQSKGKP